MNKKTTALADILDQTMTAYYIWQMIGVGMLADDYKLLYLTLRDEVKQKIGVE